MSTPFGGPPRILPVAAPGHVVDQVQSGLGQPAVRPRRRSLVAFGAVAISVLALVLLLTGALVVSLLGPVAAGVGGVLALIPLAIVLAGVSWIDRWEPEPRGILVFCVLWGAGVAVLIALVVEGGVDSALLAATGASDVADLVGSVVGAPVIEEVGKGLGVLLVFLVARRHLDSPVDGVVYAAWVAGGFAFTENIVYFGSEVLDGGVGSDLLYVFFVRGLMSPFAHVIFTAMTGLALGLAAQRGRVGLGLVAFVVGLIPAIALHALWNGALYVVPSFFGYYAVVQIPIFVGGVLLVVYLRTQEARLTYRRLSEYAAAGWFSPGEVTSLATGSGRRQARAWARARGLGSVMRRYTRDATRLAFTRQRIVTGRDAVGAEVDEQALLASIVSERAVLQEALRRG
ncbi:PrsW family intramembrane metalloprotease [Galbitalea sp. SE-J8]|uniref:PrsW family intramembrane metalloprotease n=1 Tax=Galbitalea sp. SE-J8 TaxID=3054952 RepID=UPI00259D070B|nr:PrsW family intramembrane metalloprotease [Galbitalea sp. SE-J8]MDM4762603.1 PrsW family intramembrane metalloprotease [Galbitalea sp. SE-J8]